ncbi:response regulator [Hyalangium rubrum]|uniref:Response regulator n=1 Tax=Hyalangium rubrum TaxID=3103134 RepID=A0ABU5GZD8_9BACT|nr:response regulator [Hyalangium sp. s54d21]MDY7226064.1 response regulator [Hyalangium sp. s54d21]
METQGTARRSLLLVEDDFANGLTLSALLEESGFSVVIAESCAEASRLLNAQPKYDAVLLDSLLGDGDGRSLIPLVRQQVPAARLVLVTGMDGKGPKPAVDAIFQKGRAFAELLSCLRSLLPPEGAPPS